MRARQGKRHSSAKEQDAQLFRLTCGRRAERPAGALVDSIAEHAGPVVRTATARVDLERAVVLLEPRGVRASEGQDDEEGVSDALVSIACNT